MSQRATASPGLSPRRLFRLFALGEALTWALLLGAIVARSGFGAEAVVVTVAGSVHGAMFLGYAVTAALVGVNQRWSLGRVVLGVGLAVVPFATVPFELASDRAGRLAGDWRLEPSEHPGDQRWLDRLFRWFIRRPRLLAGALIGLVALLYLVALTLGPPSEWGR